jgi:hypothetical protein
VARSVELRPKRLIGVGNVGQRLGVASYVLYNPGNDELKFKTVKYNASRGFGAA